PPRSTLFPYTTLFRSGREQGTLALIEPFTDPPACDCLDAIVFRKRANSGFIGLVYGRREHGRRRVGPKRICGCAEKALEVGSCKPEREPRICAELPCAQSERGNEIPAKRLGARSQSARQQINRVDAAHFRINRDRLPPRGRGGDEGP